jgi:hypothetical protein
VSLALIFLPAGSSIILGQIEGAGHFSEVASCPSAKATLISVHHEFVQSDIKRTCKEIDKRS